MKVLNLYFSATGNTTKVAETIDHAVQAAGHSLDSVSVGKNTEVDVMQYDFVFAGSGVYAWLPGKAMQDLLGNLRKKYVEEGLIKPASPKLPDKKAVMYCTYGGTHTGINEAVPAVKYMAQLFDHLGFQLLDEIYVIGEYVPEKMKKMSHKGRLGDISGRPDEHDLKNVAERVKGLLTV